MPLSSCLRTSSAHALNLSFISKGKQLASSFLFDANDVSVLVIVHQVALGSVCLEFVFYPHRVPPWALRGMVQGKRGSVQRIGFKRKL